MELSKDFKEFIESLNANEVKYLVVGGYAVNFHGYPRYTKDIDFWIWIEKANRKKLIKALEDFGFGSSGLTEDDFSSPEVVVQLGYEPYRIDLLVDLEGVKFDTCFANKKMLELEGVEIKFMGIDDLIIVKKISGRLQDLADAEKLEQIRDKGNKKGKGK